MSSISVRTTISSPDFPTVTKAAIYPCDHKLVVDKEIPSGGKDVEIDVNFPPSTHLQFLHVETTVDMTAKGNGESGSDDPIPLKARDGLVWVNDGSVCPVAGPVANLLVSNAGPKAGAVRVTACFGTSK